MPTQLDFLKAKVLAFKGTLESKTPHEKSWARLDPNRPAGQRLRRGDQEGVPGGRAHLPQPITWNTSQRRRAGLT